MPRSKQTNKDGVGQLTFTFGFFPKDGAQETEGNSSPASIQSVPVEGKAARKQKWHSLIDKVWTPANLMLAWEKVKVNKGASGCDGMTVTRFATNVERRLAELHDDLRKKTYRPQGVRRVMIPKVGGGERPLGIPTVRDRIVQQALLQVLEPIFESVFSNRSHGFRPERGTTTALDVIDRAIEFGYTHIVDADIQAFFDTVDHERLLAAVNEEVSDGSVLKLIRSILKAGVWLPNASELEPTELGTPQGGPLSPLLANIYLTALDRRMREHKYGLVRYADDFVIFTRSAEEAQSALRLAREVLGEGLGLTLHPEKTRVTTVNEGFEFLGFHYFFDPRAGHCKEVRLKSVHRFRAAVRLRTPRLRTQRPVKQRHITLPRLRRNRRVLALIEELNAYLRSWHGYFKGIRPRYGWGFENFDRFIRRRVRSSIVGRTGSGWWNFALSNNFLRELGLCCLDELQLNYRWEIRRRSRLEGRT